MRFVPSFYNLTKLQELDKKSYDFYKKYNKKLEGEVKESFKNLNILKNQLIKKALTFYEEADDIMYQDAITLRKFYDKHNKQLETEVNEFIRKSRSFFRRENKKATSKKEQEEIKEEEKTAEEIGEEVIRMLNKIKKMN